MINFQQYRQDFIEKSKSMSNEEWSDLGNNPFFLWAPTLSDIHVQNCTVFCSRERMLSALPQESTIAEIGTQYGEFAEKITLATYPKKFHIIDIDLSLLYSNTEKRAAVKAGLDSGSIELHEGDSSTVIATFPDNYFDWIYIDGDHSYEGVKRDIEKAYPKVKENGLLVFNDYTHWSPFEMIPYGIPRAVNEFCIANHWEIVFLALDSFLTYQDVAIRKIKDV